MSFKLNLQSAFLWALLVFVILIPANNFLEVLSMMRGDLQWGAWSEPITPIYIKIIKDFFLFFVVFLGFLKVLLDKHLLRFLLFGRFFLAINIFLVFWVLISFFSLVLIPPELVLVGFRAYWTLLLVYVGACFFDLEERAFVNAFFCVFVVHVLLQVLQFFMGSGYAVFGENRSPGAFIVPTTAGAFSLLAYYFADSSGRFYFKLLALLSLILSASTMAALVLCTYFVFRLFFIFRRHVELYFVLLAFSVGFFFFVFSNLDIVSGRGDGAYQSLFTRLGYVTSVLEELSDLAFGRGMGVATSQAVMTGMEGAVVADNTFTGAILNLGWVAVIPLLVFVLSSFFAFENKLLFFIFIGFSMVANMFEMSPVVQILMILLGQQAARHHFYSRDVGDMVFRKRVECA